MARDTLGIGMDKIEARAREATPVYLGMRPGSWPTDKVERRDPLSIWRASRSLIRCANEYCRIWLAADKPRCHVCCTPTRGPH